MSRRASALPLALVAAAASALWLLARGCGETEGPSSSPGRAGTPIAGPAVGTRSPAPREGRPRVRAASAENSGAPVADVDAQEPEADEDTPVNDPAVVREVPFPAAPTGWADMEVRVLHADGTPSFLESVHAVPAGDPVDVAAWYFQEVLPAHHSGGDGLARLRVAVPGRYEVRTSGDAWSVRTAALTVTGPTRVTLRQVLRSDVVVTLDGAAGGARPDVAFVAEPEEAAWDGGTVAGTGRPTGGLVLSETVRTVSASLPEALRWRVVVPAGWIADPPVVRPPADVRVRRDDRVEVVLAFALVPDAAVERDPRGEPAVVRFENDAGDVLEHESGFIPRCLAEGAGAGRFTESVILTVRQRRGKVRWSGAAVVAGEAVYDVDDPATPDGDAERRPVTMIVRTKNRTRRAAIGVRLDEAPSPTGSRVVGAIVTLDEAGEQDVILRQDAGVGTVTEFEPLEGWLVVASNGAGDLAAEPVRVAPGVDVALVVRRGGYVRVDRRGSADGAVVEITRSDSAPFAYPTYGGVGFESRVRLVAGRGGATLGPFAPGVVSLDAWLGRVRWRRYEVTIRAGETTSLTVGSFAAPPR